jgi:hypothetical protein
MKGFEHFSAIEQMMPKIAKGLYIYHNTNPTQASAPISNDILQPEAACLPNALTFGQLSSVTQEIIGAQASGSGPMLLESDTLHNPSSIVPSTSSSFPISSANSSAPFICVDKH